jgi:hypothetical protein
VDLVYPVYSNKMDYFEGQNSFPYHQISLFTDLDRFLYFESLSQWVERNKITGNFGSSVGLFHFISQSTNFFVNIRFKKNLKRNYN